MYVPPSCSEEYQQEAIHYLNSLPTDCDIIALGDFNAPDIDWSTLTGTTNYSHSLCNAVYNKNLTQIIITPTHKQGNTLDLILTNSPSRIINLNIQTSPSDHYMITADLLTHTSQCSKHNLKSSKFLYSRGDYESMDDFLYQTTNTSEFQQILDTDAAWNELKSTISRACEIFIPKITPLKTYPKWFDASIRHKLNCVHTIRRQSRKNPSNTTLRKLETAENELQSLIQSAKDNYLENLTTSFQHDPKKLYGHLKQLNQNKIKPNHIVENGTVIVHPREKAESFNKYFNSTFTSSSPSNLLDIDNLPPPSNYISQIEVTRADIFEALCSLDYTKSFGCDKIHPQVLKVCATSLLEPIHHIFQLCLSTSTLPQEWKMHKIAPLPKKGDLSCVSNYMHYLQNLRSNHL